MRTASGSRNGKGRWCGPDESGGLEAEVGDVEADVGLPGI